MGLSVYLYVCVQFCAHKFNYCWGYLPSTQRFSDSLRPAVVWQTFKPRRLDPSCFMKMCHVTYVLCMLCIHAHNACMHAPPCTHANCACMHSMYSCMLYEFASCVCTCMLCMTGDMTPWEVHRTCLSLTRCAKTHTHTQRNLHSTPTCSHLSTCTMGQQSEAAHP